MRSGFGILQALLVIVLVSGIMTIAMKYATVSVKQTADIYVKESAELFMDSAIELTLLAISGYDRNASNDCLEKVEVISSDKRFIADINITKYFLYKDYNLTACSRVEQIQTDESHGFVMLEATVRTDATHPKNKKKEIKITRRTLQRP